MKKKTPKLDETRISLKVRRKARNDFNAWKAERFAAIVDKLIAEKKQ